jgi:hypothetical protein
VHGAYQTARALHHASSMIDDLQRLREKLCRELAQSELDATRHTSREARRLGDVPPAHALRSIAEHADQLRPRFEALVKPDQPVGVALGRGVGEVFSALRHFVFDRMIDTERSFRGTLLGLRHGIDLTRLLREVALRQADAALLQYCDQFLVERASLLEHAEQRLAWFAEHPEIALMSGARVALQPSAGETGTSPTGGGAVRNA